MLKSKNSNVQLLYDVSLSDYILGHATIHGDKICLVDGITGEQYTYREFHDATIRCASAMARMGIKRGDIVTLYSKNSMQYPVVFHGTIATGATLVTASSALNAEELVRQLKDSKSNYFVTSSEMFDTAKEALKHYSGIKKVLVIGTAPGYTTYSDLINDDGSAFPQVTVDARNDVALIAYSSGTTGVPKGVMLTHFGLISNICQLRHPDVNMPKGTTVAFLPFSHAFGFTALLNLSITHGDKMILLPKFDFIKYMELIEKYKANMLYMVPPVGLLLAKSPQTAQFNLTTLDTILIAAAPLSEELTIQLQEKFPHVTRIMQGYGMTEAGPTTHIHQTSKPYGSCGRLLPQTECMIMDIESGKPVVPGKSGELWTRGPQLMKGYINRPQATADTIDSEGWLHTGDVGYCNSEGYFFIVDRIKELIKYKGNQVAPAELEALLLSHPDVADAAVIGLPDTEAGELPLAFVVKKPGASISEEKIKNFVADRVSPTKKLRGGVRFIPEIPKSPTGKILRRILKAKVVSEIKSKL